MSFFQEPPRLGNQFDDDVLLREYLERRRLLEPFAPELRHLGELAGGRLYEMQLADRLNEPTLTQWDAWGHRIDRITISPLWQEAARLAATHGLVATAYEQEHGEHARVQQFLKVYLLDASIDIYTCPLAMTDGAARTLLFHGNRRLVERAVPRLASRDPDTMWTSGQWMTERTGGSDVGRSETLARPPAEGDDHWRLYGTKWFTSAISSDMALTLARPDGNGPGGTGLALFYIEVRDPAGRLNGIQVNRLKDKLGTRKVPTAELTLDGARALPVAGLRDGVKNISPMLNITRTWNAIGAIAGMRRAIALGRDYARRRVAFGAPLSEKPLHLDTLADLQAEFEGAFLLTLRTVELLGREESGQATETERRLSRLITPIAKLLTAKQAVATASESLESCGGAGYVEDTGLPRLLRDAQVLPIWEGTTNVLSLDVLRVLGRELGETAPLGAYTEEVRRLLGEVADPQLRPCIEAVERALAHARAWLEEAHTEPPRLEAGARRLAFTLGRALEVSLLAAHAQWCLDHGHGRRAALAALRLTRHGIDHILDVAEPAAELRALALAET